MISLLPVAGRHATAEAQKAVYGKHFPGDGLWGGKASDAPGQSHNVVIIPT